MSQQMYEPANVQAGFFMPIKLILDPFLIELRLL